MFNPNLNRELYKMLLYEKEKKKAMHSQLQQFIYGKFVNY